MGGERDMEEVQVAIELLDLTVSYVCRFHPAISAIWTTAALLITYEA